MITYRIEIWTISKLLERYDEGKLNLNPPYQRNDIWSPSAKKRLIESVELGYPLPSFFLHQKGDAFDMVDGQQRTRTFIGFRKQFFPNLKKKYFDDSYQELFDTFQISVTIIISGEEDSGSIEDFYFRVNKYGVKLNRPEIMRSEYTHSIAQTLIEKIADNDNFVRLGLFSKKSIDRLNDHDFVAELLGLLRYGLLEKKTAADKLYAELKDQREAEALEEEFNFILDRIAELNEYYPLNKSRYRQKNDFYTFFNFLHKHGVHISQELLKYQYNLLILIGEDIYPTNDKCWPFQEYANNCVSQSNSKRAREERLIFFEKLLLNTDTSLSSEANDFLVDIVSFYDLPEPRLKSVDSGSYFLLDIESLSKIKNQPLFGYEIR